MRPTTLGTARTKKGTMEHHADTRRIMIESSVRRALVRAQASPERALRNLIDLAADSSSGAVQRPFFQHVQSLLAHGDGAYFELLRRILTDVDLDHLVTFGMNLGYEGCTKGAERIRQTERERGFNVPWALSLELPEDPAILIDATAALIDEARGLGIHVFLVYAADRPQHALHLAERFPDCAFFLFARGASIDDETAAAARRVPHVLVSVRSGSECASACERLRRQRLLFGVHAFYPRMRLADEPLPSIERALALRPYLVLLAPRPGCSPELTHAMHELVVSLREEQRYPAIVGDVFTDRLAIDLAISSGQCAAGISAQGNLVLPNGIVDDISCNAYAYGLAHVLAQMFPKERGAG